MVFNSVVFLFCFLPLALLAYYLVPGRGKNVVLLVESLLFYCWTGVEYLPLIVCLIVFNYLWGLLTARTKAKLKGLLPAVAVLVNLAALVYFKYANFLIDTLNRIGNFGLAALDVGAVLPLGISYYIFKIISYEADVYTGKVEAEKDPIALAAYVLFFPQLIVGPIIKYRDMAPQLHNYKNRCNAALMERGVELFLFGLAKKVILADSIGALWTDIISTGGVGLSNVSTPLAWLGIIAYSLQLYFDFAGYSEMSNGLAALMGFDCAANFDLPYISARMGTPRPRSMETRRMAWSLMSSETRIRLSARASSLNSVVSLVPSSWFRWVKASASLTASVRSSVPISRMFSTSSSAKGLPSGMVISSSLCTRPDPSRS